MRIRSTVLALATLTVVVVQVLLFRGLKYEPDPTELKIGSLEQQIQSLKNSTRRLEDFDLRLKAKLKALASGGTARRHQKASTSETTGDRSFNLAILADQIGKENEAAAERALSAGSATFPDVSAEGDTLIFPPGNEDRACVGQHQPAASNAVAAVVTVTFDRADYLKRHLESLLAVHGKDTTNRVKFPLHVSQDGEPPKHAVAELAKSYGAQGVRYLHHREDVEPKRLLNRKENLAYYRIANHYKFVLKTFFECFGYSKLIILEDDMELSPDFFSYFEATGRVLANDPTLFCVSSWNDHGQAKFVEDEKRLYRSDFFPGLGWMLTKDFWEEIRQDWPKSYWDDWMRLSKVRKGRQCIRPEISRTYNFGARGSSKGFYFKRFLAPIRLNSAEIDWSREDLSYLQQERYDTDLNATLASAKELTTIDEAKTESGDVLYRYDSQEHYEALTGRLGMLREWKDGIPRGSYRGIVVVHWEKARLFIAPSSKFKAPTFTTANVRLDATGAVVRRSQRKALPAKKSSESELYLL